MKKLDLNDVAIYVEQNIGTFHLKRIQKIKSLNLTKILLSKNPYLFKAKYLLTADQIINSLVTATISSSEESMFGDWLEGLAIFVNQKVYGGWKSGIKGIDLEFDDKNTRYIVTIKSGPSWGNSSQIEKMVNHFNTARRTLTTGNSKLQIVAVNGCCYGRENHQLKTENYYKYCGQKFWEFISGNKLLYTEIIEPLGYKAKEKNDDFMLLYSQLVNKLTLEFLNDFCFPNGMLNWKKIVEFNSKA
ncbi:PmeII family type II restriction endonuclease [Mucilaginibacter sp.]|uniref:PmeII family type II restriction endonuclease n=1 Tax=Mucilaginibacter sp. TaxID=1882438 RepID=UPI00283E91BB|nr:PmeII family type II restriction endonuclease [Mucilaginibacter sp.]MDR3697093.1 PmeII family type II restriction endonuclease [Mucilaginibacter sp.]